MDYELQFLLMINCVCDFEEFRRRIKTGWQGIRWITRSSFDYGWNWVQISENDDYDLERIDDAEEGFLYYRYQFEVSPVEGGASVAGQMKLAQELKKKLEGMGCVVVICADFEDLL